MSDEPSIEISAESPGAASVYVGSDTSEEPSPGASAKNNSALQVRDDELFVAEDERAVYAGVSAPPTSVASVVRTVHPSDGDLPDFRRKPGRATFAAVVASAAALVVASIAWSQFANPRERSVATDPARVPERTPERVPEPPSPKSVPSPATPVTNEAASTPAPALEGAVGASPEQAVTTVAVTIKSVPEGAAIFRAGERLGSGVVQVNVERKLKQRFTALLDGYTPANFTLDGSRDSVTIVLRRVPKRRVAPPRGSDSPYYDEPSEPATQATAAAPPPAPAPENTTPAAPIPPVSPPESASE